MTTFGQSYTYYISLVSFIEICFLFFWPVWAHISFLNVQSFLNVCLYTVQSVIEHPKTTSVSQPDSKKIQELIGSTSCFGAENPFLTHFHIHFRIGFFTPIQPLNPRLARKNKEVGLGTYRKAANFVRGLSVHASVPNDAVQSGSMPEFSLIRRYILILEKKYNELHKGGSAL